MLETDYLCPSNFFTNLNETASNKYIYFSSVITANYFSQSNI
jgi:hypothetical protein